MTASDNSNVVDNFHVHFSGVKYHEKSLQTYNWACQSVYVSDGDLLSMAQSISRYSMMIGTAIKL